MHSQSEQMSGVIVPSSFTCVCARGREREKERKEGKREEKKESSAVCFRLPSPLNGVLGGLVIILYNGSNIFGLNFNPCTDTEWMNVGHDFL